MAKSPEALERKRRARAAAHYSAKSATVLAVETGIPYGTLKGLLGPAGAAPSDHQVRLIVAACELPSWFADYGFAPPATAINQVEADKRVADLEQSVTQLRAGLVALAAGNLKHMQELLGLTEEDRPEGP